MVTVLSMAPSIDKRLELDGLLVGGTNRVRAWQADGAGKGINVALGLAALSVPVMCIGVLAGGGDIVTDRLVRNGVAHAFIPTPGIVRTNYKLADVRGNVITEINEPAPPVPTGLLEQAAGEAIRAAKDSRFLVLSGSLPSQCPAAFYANIIRRVKEEAPSCRVMLDTDGERFRLGIRAAPFAIKPNLHEMETEAGKKLSAIEERLTAARAVLASGPELVALSMGAGGALAIGRTEAYFAPAIPIETVTTTGAGDAMVAGLLCGLLRGETLAGVLAHGAAAAAARCAGAGDRFIDPERYRAYLTKVTTRKIA
ncbi:MAG: 1-phosphofructokinase family hexose kinase [Clostridia bacterium]|nr:1-phosphofructokinase family hexose kinase [Clostridia bacterium]